MEKTDDLVVHVDWLQGLLHFTSWGDLDDFLGFLNSSCDRWYKSNSSFWSGRSFASRIDSLSGGTLAYNFISSGYEVLLVFPGGYFSTASVDWVSILLKKLVSLNFTCTRLDIAIDDFSRSVSLDTVLDAAYNNSIVGFESYRHIDGNGVSTVYFGSPSSDKQLRFYDCDFVHQIPADRWELQLRRDYANSVLFGVNLDNLAFDLGSYFFSLVRFVDRDSSSTVTNCDLLPWWDNLASRFLSISFSLPKSFSSLGKLDHWFTKQVLPSLCVFRFGLGREAFFNFIEVRCHDALLLDRLSSKHYALIDFLQINQEVI